MLVLSSSMLYLTDEESGGTELDEKVRYSIDEESTNKE